MIGQPRKLVQYITSEISQFTDLAVVAMSGGADSTLVAILCTLALGPSSVYSLHLPMNQADDQTFNHRSWRTAERLGINKLRLPITEPVDALTHLLSQGCSSELSALNKGNARARIRMCLAYGFCAHLGETHKKRARVIGTGNLSEDFIGYDTKGGDALADIFPIGELFKSEVYQLLEHFCKEGVIDASMIDYTPSAGLWPEQTDELELGYSYDQMEPSIRAFLKDPQMVPRNDVDRFVLERHRVHKHKHEAIPVLPLRSLI